jgi:hypothetical protein
VGFGGVSEAGVALETGTARGAAVSGLESCVSACTFGMEIVITTPAIAIDDAPASNQIRNGAFELKLLDSRRSTICQSYQIDTWIVGGIARFGFSKDLSARLPTSCTIIVDHIAEFRQAFAGIIVS